MLFWQFANDIVPVEQAKRFYPLFGQMSSLAPVVAGLCVVRFTNAVSSSGAGKGKGVTEGLLDFVLVRDAALPSPCVHTCSLSILPAWLPPCLCLLCGLYVFLRVSVCVCVYFFIFYVPLVFRTLFVSCSDIWPVGEEVWWW